MKKGHKPHLVLAVVSIAALFVARDAVAQIDIKIKIYVTGLAHLVANPTPEVIVLPNHRAISHEVLLLAEKKYEPIGLCEGPETQDTTMKELFWRKAAGFEIVVAPQDASLSYDTSGDTEMAECPSVAQSILKTSLHWLPRLKDVSDATSVTIDPEILKTDPSPAIVSTRLLTTKGKLEAVLPRQEDAFKFKTRTQRVADYLLYTFTVKADATNPTYTLMGRRFGEATQIPLATLRAQNNEVEIFLANVVPANFFQPRIQPTLVHFPHYYDAYSATVPPKNQLIHTPTRKVAHCGAGAGGGIECGPDRLP